MKCNKLRLFLITNILFFFLSLFINKQYKINFKNLLPIFCKLVNEGKNFKKELIKIKKAVSLGNKLNLEVHAGHGLTYSSAKILSKIKGIKEFNIGHFLIGESIFVGLEKTIKHFRKIIR